MSSDHVVEFDLIQKGTVPVPAILTHEKINHEIAVC